MPIHIKICGITNPSDAQAAVAAGADALGLIFAPSPRRVSLADAEAIRMSVPTRVELVGVFVAEPIALVHDAILTIGLGGVQFHRDMRTVWTASEWIRWEELLLTRRLRQIQAVRARDAASLHGEIAGRLEQADQILMDAYVPGKQGGTGQTFDWSLVDTAKQYGKPVIVAGGLNAENVAEAVRRTQPWGVDVSSGVESEPGRKDHAAVRRFIQSARAAANGEEDLAW